MIRSNELNTILGHSAQLLGEHEDELINPSICQSFHFPEPNKI
jgi:hypothetical protein